MMEYSKTPRDKAAENYDSGYENRPEPEKIARSSAKNSTASSTDSHHLLDRGESGNGVSFSQKAKATASVIPFAMPPGYKNAVPIGHGAQATVFRAVNRDGKCVAIKCFDRQAFSNWKDEELLHREVSVLRELDCEGIPKYIDFIENDRYSLLIESYINAPSLAQRIQQGYRPTIDDAITILRNAANVFKGFQNKLNPIIHRDIKPANILVDSELNVYIVDFGVVAAIRQHTMGMTFAGTAGYLAPEQLYNKVTPAADIFGLGMSMIHLISGVAPCDMDMSGLTPKVDKYLPVNMPPELIVLLHDMIEPDPTHRIQNADELCERLQNFDLLKSTYRNRTKRKKTLTLQQKIAIRDRIQKKYARNAEKMRKRASEKKYEYSLKARQSAHAKVYNRLNLYRTIFILGIIQLVIMFFVVGMSCIVDGLLYTFLDGWRSIFQTHYLHFFLVSMPISCYLILMSNHMQNRGFFALDDDSKFVIHSRAENKTLNDMYMYVLNDENCENSDLCEPKILDKLLWELSSNAKVFESDEDYAPYIFEEEDNDNHGNIEEIVEISHEYSSSDEEQKEDDVDISKPESSDVVNKEVADKSDDDVIDILPVEVVSKSSEVMNSESVDEETLEDDLKILAGWVYDNYDNIDSVEKSSENAVEKVEIEKSEEKNDKSIETEEEKIEKVETEEEKIEKVEIAEGKIEEDKIEKVETENVETEEEKIEKVETEEEKIEKVETEEEKIEDRTIEESEDESDESVDVEEANVVKSIRSEYATDVQRDASATVTVLNQKGQAQEIYDINEEDCCIACPPEKLNVFRLLLSLIPTFVAILVMCGIQMTSAEWLTDLESFVYYLVVIFSVGIPGLSFFRYIKRRSICSDAYRKMYHSLYVDYILQCEYIRSAQKKKKLSVESQEPSQASIDKREISD